MGYTIMKKASVVFREWLAHATMPAGVFDEIPAWKRHAIEHLCEAAFERGRIFERNKQRKTNEQ